MTTFPHSLKLTLSAMALAAHTLAHADISATTTTSANGSALSLDARVDLNQTESGIRQEVYILLATPTQGAFFRNSNGMWVPYATNAAIPVARTTTSSVSLNVLSNADIASLDGSDVYVGYGTTLNDMLQRKNYQRVYRVAKPLDASFEPGDGVRIMSASPVIINDSTLTVTAQEQAENNLVTGSVLIAPNGAWKITSVEASTPDAVTLRVTSPDMSEVFKTLNIKGSVNLSGTDVLRQSVARGVTLEAPTTGGAAAIAPRAVEIVNTGTRFGLKLVDVELGSSAKLNGSMQIANPIANVDISWPTRFDVQMSGKVESDLSLTVDKGVGFDDLKRVLYSFRVPVTAVPGLFISIPFSSITTLSSNAKATFSINGGLDLDVGVKYNGLNITPINGTTTYVNTSPPLLDPAFEGEVSANVGQYIGVDLDLELLTEPLIGLKNKFGLGASVTATSGLNPPSLCGTLEANGIVSGSIETTLLSTEFTYPLYDVERPIFSNVPIQVGVCPDQPSQRSEEIQVTKRCKARGMVYSQRVPVVGQLSESVYSFLATIPFVDLDGSSNKDSLSGFVNIATGVAEIRTGMSDSRINNGIDIVRRDVFDLRLQTDGTLFGSSAGTFTSGVSGCVTEIEVKPLATQP